MTIDRAIQLLQIERDYCLKQRGFQRQPINQEVAEALEIAIEAIKTVQRLERYIEMKGRDNG